MQKVLTFFWQIYCKFYETLKSFNFLCRSKIKSYRACLVIQNYTLCIINRPTFLKWQKLSKKIHKKSLVIVLRIIYFFVKWCIPSPCSDLCTPNALYALCTPNSDITTVATIYRFLLSYIHPSIHPF